ncbi:enoyl-CoA hydratase/isomerase family protein [Streptomyces sp. WI04-05B]|uniref:enoyl-CoA hydratase/isomerase family protein n=1 Tax=Streptomyces TaxID=1883 RepID=UPI0029ABCE49|nr:MULTISPECIES: enoyl-CoA hydratase-related protein [unclassified Streptomyces]MDX2545063.1 enoyl-CoA hydratase-related protein [Streptomyces sp. WI04-05B]MDX2587554.1 enoyl-CoA hydratase-related protein [Streptomyces sp. WI04-05A]
MPRIRLDADGPVVTVRLDHPPLNAFDTPQRDELAARVRELADEPRVRAVVLYGGERLFAAGADVKALAEMGIEEVRGWNRALQRTFDEVAQLPMPVVAAITGYALGGGLELALAADHRIAADDALLGQPEVLLGILPGSGGTQRLTRLIGPSRAKNLLMTGRRVDATEALRLGLVDEVVPAAEVHTAALRYAHHLAKGPAAALEAIKEAVNHGTDTSMSAGLALERALFTGVFGTRDAAAGLQSFLADGPGRARFDGAGEGAP